LFRKEVVEHKSRVQYGDLIISYPPKYKISLLFILFAFVLLIVVALSSEYHQTVKVDGKLNSTGSLLKIRATKSGYIDQIFVNQGEQIRKGDKLFSISSVNSNILEYDPQKANINKLAREIKISEEKKNYQSKLDDIKQDDLITQKESLEIEINQLNKKRNLANQSYEASKNIYSNNLKLFNDDLISIVDFAKIERDYLSSKLYVQDIDITITRTNLQLTSLLKQIDGFPEYRALKALEIDNYILGLAAKKREEESLLSNTVIAPNDGVVASILKVDNNLITPSELVLTIQQNQDGLIGVLHIESASIGFIRKGQNVKIRYDSFPYQRYGVFEGTVAGVSEHSFSQADIESIIRSKNYVYKVDIKLMHSTMPSQENSGLHFKSGMKFQADVIVDSLSLFEYLLGV
jgi:membrane fusion protein